MVVSAILNLGNIQFEEGNENESACLKTQSRKFLYNAAALLKVPDSELEDVLLCHTRSVGSETIK